MSAIYELIGRFVVRLVWFRFGRQIQVAGGVVAASRWSSATWLRSATPPEG